MKSRIYNLEFDMRFNVKKFCHFLCTTPFSCLFHFNYFFYILKMYILKKLYLIFYMRHDTNFWNYTIKTNFRIKTQIIKINKSNCNLKNVVINSFVKFNDMIFLYSFYMIILYFDIFFCKICKKRQNVRNSKQLLN